MLMFGICLLVALVMVVLLITYRNLREDELRELKRRIGCNVWESILVTDIYPRSHVPRLKTLPKDIWRAIKTFLAWLWDD